MASVFNIEVARQARIARETRCHYIDLKPPSKRKVKAACRRDEVRIRAKLAL